MVTTGIFTVQRYQINVKHLNKPFYLFPFGDIHRSSNMCSVKHWKDFTTWARTKERALFLGMGDYDDLASTSERKILLNAEFHESTKDLLEETYNKNVMRLSKEIEFMNGSLIGLIEGNHYGVYPTGITTTQKMCDILKCKYLGASSFVRLTFKYGTRETSIDIFAHHGKGAARLVGGSLNRIQQMGEAAQADIYLMGHDHKKSVGTSSKLFLGGGNGKLEVKHKKQLYVRTGSFLKGYEDGVPSYIVDGAMNPTDLGVVKIEMTPRAGDNDGLFIDLHASV
jgi:hypothetical protein